MRYRDDLPYVLKNLSFSIPAGAKVGVVGRTGAGKTSLLQALFRLVESESEGLISIDGQSTREVGLHTLREGLALIPQVPFLFEGSVR